MILAVAEATRPRGRRVVSFITSDCGERVNWCQLSRQKVSKASRNRSSKCAFVEEKKCWLEDSPRALCKAVLGQNFSFGPRPYKITTLQSHEATPCLYYGIQLELLERNTDNAPYLLCQYGRISTGKVHGFCVTDRPDNWIGSTDCTINTT